MPSVNWAAHDSTRPPRRPSVSTVQMRQEPQARINGWKQRFGTSIPARRAASRILVPAGTVTSWPLIVPVTILTCVAATMGEESLRWRIARSRATGWAGGKRSWDDSAPMWRPGPASVTSGVAHREKPGTKRRLHSPDGTTATGLFCWQITWCDRSGCGSRTFIIKAFALSLREHTRGHLAPGAPGHQTHTNGGNLPCHPRRPTHLPQHFVP